MKSYNLKHNQCFSVVKLPAGLFCWSLLISPWPASTWLQAVPLGLGTALLSALVSFSGAGNTVKNSSFPTGFWKMPMTHSSEDWAKSRSSLDSSFCALLLWAMTADGHQRCGLFPSLLPTIRTLGGPEIIVWVRDTFFLTPLCRTHAQGWIQWEKVLRKLTISYFFLTQIFPFQRPRSVTLPLNPGLSPLLLILNEFTFVYHEQSCWPSDNPNLLRKKEWANVRSSRWNHTTVIKASFRGSIGQIKLLC